MRVSAALMGCLDRAPQLSPRGQSRARPPRGLWAQRPGQRPCVFLSRTEGPSPHVVAGRPAQGGGGFGPLRPWSPRPMFPGHKHCVRAWPLLRQGALTLVSQWLPRPVLRLTSC